KFGHVSLCVWTVASPAPLRQLLSTTAQIEGDIYRARCLVGILLFFPRAENNGASDLPVSPVEGPPDSERPPGMSEVTGEVTVLPFAPTADPQLDRPAQEQRTLTRLYCKNGGYHLRVSADGRVGGARLDNDPYDVLRLKAVSVGVVVIKGEHSGRFLAMDAEGHLYGALTLNDECHFFEKYEENHYNTYRSQKYGWYMGLKKNGQSKPGRDTHLGQKAVFFLPRPV
ncbi:hypothetical protein WMY93_008629, partial [Mugilogobius chulae]